MTNEQAIELLHRLSDEQFDGIHGDERREALEMAVRALEGDGDMISRQAVMKEFSDFVRKSNNSDFAQTPTWNDAVSLVGSMPSAQIATDTNVGDTIGRQAAIDAVAKAKAGVFPHDAGINNSIKAIKALPSAQPERILYANISDAEFEKWLYEHGICNPNIHESIPCDAVPLLIDNAISELLSAQPERKKGEWEEIEVIPEAYDIAGVKTWASMMRCNQCGFTTFAIEGHFAQYDFCPSCGADMRGESE